MSMDDHASASRQVWREFCAKLADAGDVLLRSEAPRSEREQAEGLHCLTQVLRLALIVNIEASDPDFPVFYKLNDDVTQFYAINPDNVYWTAVVKGDRNYKISGKRADVFYFSIQAQANRMHLDGTIPCTGELTDRDINADSDGHFEIVASSRPQPGNWLKMEADTNLILIRQTMRDPLSERPGTYKIARMDGPRERPPLTRSGMESRLLSAVQFLSGSINRFSDVLLPLMEHVNQLPDLGQRFWRDTGADPMLCYLYGYFRIAADEAWILEFSPPPSPYWNFAIYNFWGQLLHYPERPVTINAHTARYNLDGTVTIVVSAEDAGFRNWLDTDGHTEGQAFFRGMDMATVPVMKCRVAKIADLK